MTADQIKRRLSKELQPEERALAAMLARVVTYSFDQNGRVNGPAWWPLRSALWQLGALTSVNISFDAIDAMINLIEHPVQLCAEDFTDLARGRLGRVVGPLAPQPDMRQYSVALLAAVRGRVFRS
jgi:hypothetical protein